MASHPIVHVDIPAENREEAAQFYGKVFGWQVQQMPEMNYATFQADGGPAGGFPPVGEDLAEPNRVVVYIGTDDLKSTLDQVKANGGTVVMPPDEIPGGYGWLAFFKDPTGNHIGLFSEKG